MGMLFVIALLVAAAFISRKFAGKRGKGRKATGQMTAIPPLTEAEQAMFNRLSEALPDRVILAQVAFSALLDTKDRPTRATFDRKRADFVVCSKAFQVLAVVELDDASHKGRAQEDAKREQMLTGCGYRVLRYKRVPDIEQVRSDFLPQPLLQKPAA